MPVAIPDELPGAIRPQLNWFGRLRAALETRAYRVRGDASLVRLARERNYAAFDALVARYRKRLDTIAVLSHGNEGEASDALLATVLQAFKDIDSFGRQCTPGTSLYQQGIRAFFKRMDPPPLTRVFANRAAW